jgi:hypothetical protein
VEMRTGQCWLCLVLLTRCSDCGFTSGPRSFLLMVGVRATSLTFQRQFNLARERSQHSLFWPQHMLSMASYLVDGLVADDMVRSQKLCSIHCDLLLSRGSQPRHANWLCKLRSDSTTYSFDSRSTIVRPPQPAFRPAIEFRTPE